MKLQRHWDARAAANFILGGTGSGLLAVAAFAPNPYAVALGLVLIACGLGAVWLEIGRKLRAVNVFFNPFTSWMTRESFAALLVFGGGIGFLAFDEKNLLYATAAFAALFLYCQARILHGAKGIPAWRARQTVPLVVATGLAEGAGVALLFATQDLMMGLLALAVIARLFAWHRYREAVRSTALEAPGKGLLWLGTVAPLALLLVTPLAGLAALAAGWWLKFALVTRAAHTQGFSLPHLPVRGTR
jgi:phenylacetyl-CoA:acceptor oxidoreductase subunit 2